MNLGPVAWEKETDKYWVSLGPVGHMTTLVWPLCTHDLVGATELLFTLSVGVEPLGRMPCLVVWSEQAFSVVH